MRLDLATAVLSDWAAWLWGRPYSTELVATGVALIAGWAGRWIATARLTRLAVEPDDRLRWRVAARNVALAITVTVIALIWADVLERALLSVVAIAAAVVLATKEFLLCLSGGVYRSFSRSFSVGDRIEVAGWRGDVVDFGPLATTLLEVGPGRDLHQATGRTVSLPNSLFLEHPVVNETFTDAYVLHSFTISLPRSVDWRTAEADLIAAATAECAEWVEEASRFLQQKLERYTVTPIHFTPRVHLSLVDADTLSLVARVPCPNRQKNRVEQAILRRFLDASAAHGR
jgi:small-conductance mechanosensitive channel